MKLAMAMAGLMLLQLGDFGAGGPASDPQHLRYERSILMPAGSSYGVACAVLDASALAHSASRSGDDLRVFDEPGGARQPDLQLSGAQQPGAQQDSRAQQRSSAAPVEIPFLLTESEAVPGDAEPAMVHNIALRRSVIVFDLAMPHRAYTTVDLHLAAKDFLGSAKVWGMQAPGAAQTGLGVFTIFDLSGEHLPHWTSLPLQESNFPMLHIELRLHGVNDGNLSGLSAATVQGADVPPSREAQTLYTAIAATDAIHQQGAWTAAKLQVPAHVPIERVSFVLGRDFTQNFLRAVTVVARALKPNGVGAVETADGEIWRVKRASGGAGEPAVQQAKLNVDAVLASNLRSPARITVAVQNGNDPALPIREVKLEMRQRTICFQAAAGRSYTLRYGDAALAAPRYDFTGSGLSGAADSARSLTLLQPSATSIAARLGPEQINPRYVARPGARPYTERHPELFWIGLLVSTTLLGAVAMQSVRRQGRST